MLLKTRQALIFLIVLLSAGSAAAMHPTHPEGYSPEKAYRVGAVDNVDLFSGTLGLRIPIGPFSLNYGSSVWLYETTFDGQGVPHIKANPNRKNNAGFGWYLGWGEVYRAGHWYNDTGKWLFVGPNGGRHLFYQQLHRGEDDGDPDVLYTRDNSYLRLRVYRNGSSVYDVEIEFPDGMTRRFHARTGGGGSDFRLQKGWSRFASAADPDFDVTYNSDFTLWTLTDRYGRSHNIHVTNQYPWLKVITQIDLESFQGARARYDFSYRLKSVYRSCKDDDPGSSTTMSLPLLTRIDLPDGTFYSMEEAGQPSYHRACSGNIDDLPGALKEIRLPTGGRLAWGYQQYEFPPGSNHSPFNTSAGVKNRYTKDAAGTILGTWTYKTTSVGAANGNHPEIHTQVVNPTGDCSKHFFDAMYWLDPSAGEGWELGLPFVRTAQSGGKYLSSEIWTSHVGRSCSGTKLRSTYLKYQKDALPGTNESALDFYNTNRRVSGTRTVYHDDGDRWTDSVSSSFNGLGRYRQVVTTGNFWAGSTTNERRTAFTHFTPQATLATTAPWLPGLFDYQTVSEPDAVGETVSKVEYGVEEETGFVTCRRTLASGTARSANDLLITYQRDSLGLVTDVKSYGGDLQPLPTFGGGGSQCGALPAEPEYWMTYGYQDGSRVTTLPMRPDGTPGSFLTYDVDRDAATGLVTAVRDATGLSTTYSYDSIGRLTSITPPARASVIHTFENPTAKKTALIRTQIVDGVEILAESEVILDDLGRAWKQRQKLPGEVWSERETLYDARGRVLSVSEPGDLTKKTTFLGYDPFGRVTIVRPPDGSAHDVRLTFAGARRVTTEVSVAQPGGEGYFSGVQEMDRYGRLRKVLEGSGALGELVPTAYGYDVGGRLTNVETAVETKTGILSQNRSFTYDNRGFQLTEAHPEKGPSGNGTVFYSGHDSSGLLHHSLDGPNELDYAYDFMGRLTLITDAANGGRLVTKLEYDGAAGFGTGKLWRATRFNWHDLPWRIGGEEAVKVREINSYGDPTGAVSQRTTRVIFPGEAQKIFVQRVGYGALGTVSRLFYPTCQHATCTATVGAGRAVDYVYDQGLLAEVPGWTGILSYSASGLLTDLPHSNGVTDHQLPDPAIPSRPVRFQTSGASENWDSGSYLYDGAGNIKEMFRPGAVNTFAYDGVNRLIEATVEGWHQDYSYDPFGNLTAMTTTPPGGAPSTLNIPADPGTNRLTSAVYDGAGNTTSWAGNFYDWDRGNRIKSVNGRWVYLFTSGGERVAEIDWTGSAAERKTIYTLRGPGNRVVSRFLQTGDDVAGAWSRERDYVYAAGRLLASDGGGETRHYHLDHLGSPRLITDAAGVSQSSHDLLPYGEEITPPGDEIMKFTGHERDQATGLDYMHARHYSSTLGRFLSLDELLGSLSSPQSLNRYSYVQGAPLTLVDPDGRSGRDPKLLARKYEACGKDRNCQILGHIAQRSDPAVTTLSVFVEGVVNFFGKGAASGSLKFGANAYSGVRLLQGIERINESLEGLDEYYDPNAEITFPEFYTDIVPLQGPQMFCDPTTGMCIVTEVIEVTDEDPAKSDKKKKKKEKAKKKIEGIEENQDKTGHPDSLLDPQTPEERGVFDMWDDLLDFSNFLNNGLLIFDIGGGGWDCSIDISCSYYK